MCENLLVSQFIIDGMTSLRWENDTLTLNFEPFWMQISNGPNTLQKINKGQDIHNVVFTGTID